MFFKKKSETQKIVEIKHELENMAASMDVLISLAKDNAELVDVLEEIQGKVKYFNPTQDKDVQALDKKINNKLGDLKIDISKGKNKEDYTKALETAREVRDILVVERTAKANRK